MLTGAPYAQESLSRTQVHMGTFVTITLDKQQGQWVQKGFERFKAVEKALSSYDSDADIYRLNHERRADISPYTYEALLLCRRYYVQSDGYFNIAVGAITKTLFRFGEEERIVDDALLDRAETDFDGVFFDRNSASLSEGVHVDLGGMGKGFGVDKVARLYREQGISSGVIAASGDIRCLDRCEIAVEDPFSEGGHIARFRTLRSDTGISTSGNYRRYIKEKHHNHLIDPKHKRPQQIFASITLVGKQRNSDLDAYATAASVMPLDKALSFLGGLDAAYILIMADGGEIRSPNLSMFVSELK